MWAQEWPCHILQECLFWEHEQGKGTQCSGASDTDKAAHGVEQNLWVDTGVGYHTLLTQPPSKKK